MCEEERNAACYNQLLISLYFIPLCRLPLCRLPLCRLPLCRSLCRLCRSPLLIPLNLRRSRKRYQSSLVAKHLAKIAYQLKYMLQVAPSLSTSSLNFSVKCGIKREFPKTSRMPQLSTFTRRKGTGSHVTITVEYPSCP